MGVNFYIKKANYEGKLYVDTQFDNVMSVLSFWYHPIFLGTIRNAQNPGL